MRAKKKGSIEELAVVGIDIGKETFHLVGFDRSGQLVMRKQIKRLTAARPPRQAPHGHNPGHTEDCGQRGAVSLNAGLTRMVTSPITISTIGSGALAAPASIPLFRKARRQRNSCVGEIPKRRARAETFPPGSSAARTACFLKSSDRRRRSPTGAPSKRSTTASTN